VQLTPLARPWAGRDSPGKALRPAGNPTMRNLQALLAPQHSWRSNGRLVGRTRIAWQLPPAAVLHPSHACQRRS